MNAPRVKSRASSECLPSRESSTAECRLICRDTSEWDAKVQKRDEVLQKLEEAEMRYIQSFRLVPTASNGQRLESVTEEVGLQTTLLALTNSQDIHKGLGRQYQPPQDYLAPKGR